jgi:hypothetical protein
MTSLQPLSFIQHHSRHLFNTTAAHHPHTALHSNTYPLSRHGPHTRYTPCPSNLYHFFRQIHAFLSFPLPDPSGTGSSGWAPATSLTALAHGPWEMRVEQQPSRCMVAPPGRPPHARRRRPPRRPAHARRRRRSSSPVTAPQAAASDGGVKVGRGARWRPTTCMSWRAAATPDGARQGTGARSVSRPMSRRLGLTPWA